MLVDMYCIYALHFLQYYVERTCISTQIYYRMNWDGLVAHLWVKGTIES
jgi:hypothetical protein